LYESEYLTLSQYSERPKSRIAEIVDAAGVRSGYMMASWSGNVVARVLLPTSDFGRSGQMDVGTGFTRLAGSVFGCRAPGK